MKEISKKQFIKGSIWKIIEQFSTKGVSLVVSIFLTRLLSPNAYGLIALTMVFTNLSDILLDGGFSTALIRKKEVDDYDYSCVMVVSFSLSGILYFLLFIGAPYISDYYGEEELTLILRVIGLMLFLQAFSAIRTAIVNRNMQFKILFKCNFWGTLLSGIIGILAALMNLDVWALVIQRLLQLTLSTVFLFLSIRWKIKFRFSINRLKEIFKFSSGVVLSSIINYLSTSLYNLFVGKRYSVTDLGYSDKGTQLPQQVSLYTFGAMSSVLLPTLSSYQSDLGKMKNIVRKVVRMTSYLITPMMVGMVFVSQELVIILFTETWIPAVPIMQAYCLYYFATPFMLIYTQVFFALGHSNSRVKTELIRMIMLIGAIGLFGIGLNCTIYQLAYVCAVVAVLSALVTFFEAAKMINYKLKEFLCDIKLSTTASLIMGMILYVSDIAIKSNNIIPVGFVLVVKVLIGSGIYLLFSDIFKMEGYEELKRMLNSFRRNHE